MIENRSTMFYLNNTLLPGYNAGLQGRDLTHVIRQLRYNRRLQLFSNGLKTLLILHYWARRIFVESDRKHQ
jgi:hypothetical protein